MHERTMRHNILLTLTLAAFGLVAYQGAWAGEIRYLAWNDEFEEAAVETAAGAQWVGLGDWVPGFGTVVDIDEERVVLRRILDETEREALASQGFLSYAAEEAVVLREDLRFHILSAEP